MLSLAMYGPAGSSGSPGSCPCLVRTLPAPAAARQPELSFYPCEIQTGPGHGRPQSPDCAILREPAGQGNSSGCLAAAAGKILMSPEQDQPQSPHKNGKAKTKPTAANTEQQTSACWSAGQAVGAESEGQTASAKFVVGDPSYFPDKVRRMGQVVRAICILNHPIPGTDNSHSSQIIIPQKQVRA